MVLKEQDLVPQLDEMLACSRPSPDRRPKSQPKQLMKCPRCDSLNTKFCYYNNYSLTQPRHFCKACRRYWTKGGILRNVPVGGGCRKNKRSKTKNAEQQRATTASDSTLSTTDPAAMRGEDSCVTNVSAFSSCDGSPSAPTSQNVAGSCTTSGYFSLPRDDAGSVRSPFDGLDKVKHVLSLGEQAGISNSHTIFSRGDTENFPSFLSSSNMSVDCLTLSDAGRMGFNFSSSPIFGRADMGLLSNGDMCQVYESLPSHITGSNSTSDFENIGMLADRSNLGYYWALHQLHKLGVPFEEGHTTDGQSIREDPLTESWRHTKGKVNVAGHSFLEEISNGFPGSFDWQLPSEQLFETPGDLCCLPGGMWSDFSQLGPCSGPFT